MRLKKLLFLEIVVVILLLISVFAYIEIKSYLGLSQNLGIGLYKERVFAEGTVIVSSGEIAMIQFTYLSYEPAILVMELTSRSVDKPGYLIMRCNNRPLEPIMFSKENYTVTLNAISISGVNWVEPLSSMFGLNEITIESQSESGFQGKIEYQIKLRGTR